MNPHFPDVYIVGAAKAGTTTLIDLLRQHPKIFVPHEKEPHHFSVRAGQDWLIHDGNRVRHLHEVLPYADEAGYLALYRGAPEGALRVDASTQYLVNERAARLIHVQRPDARILICLRSPVDRVYSAYLHARSRGEEPCPSLCEALDECEAGKRHGFFAINYIEESRYDRHLEMYRQFFGEAVRVIPFEDLITSPEEVFHSACTFLGLDSNGIQVKASHKNPSVEFSHPLALRIRILAKRLRRAAPRLFAAPIARHAYEALLATMGNRPPAIEHDTAQRIYRLLQQSICTTERVLGRDMPAWHEAAKDAKT